MDPCQSAASLQLQTRANGQLPVCYHPPNNRWACGPRTAGGGGGEGRRRGGTHAKRAGVADGAEPRRACRRPQVAVDADAQWADCRLEATAGRGATPTQHTGGKPEGRHAWQSETCTPPQARARERAGECASKRRRSAVPCAQPAGPCDDVQQLGENTAGRNATRLSHEAIPTSPAGHFFTNDPKMCDGTDFTRFSGQVDGSARGENRPTYLSTRGADAAVITRRPRVAGGAAVRGAEQPCCE